MIRSKKSMLLCSMGTILVVSALMAIVLMWSFTRYQRIQEKSPYNRGRLLVANDLEAIDQKIYENVKEQFYILNLEGIVIYSNINQIDVGDKKNLQEELQIDHAVLEHNNSHVKLVFPIYNQSKDMGEVNRFAVFYLEKKKLEESSLLNSWGAVVFPIVLLVGVIAIWLIVREIRWKRKVIQPIETLIEHSKTMIQGNYYQTIQLDRKKDDYESCVEKLYYYSGLMQDELRHKSEREEELNKVQRELLSCISHDLRTPVSTIKAHAEALRDHVAKDEKRREEYVITIIQKTDILSKMIKDLLDHFNAQLGQLAIKKEDIYIDEYFETYEKEWSVFCSHYHTAFQMQADLPKLLVSMDVDRISQVIYNLIENGIKYNENVQKEIHLKVWYDEFGHKIFISIKDNGLGIQMTDIPYVFQAFYRAEKSRSIQIPGSGLGLSICKRIVEAHDGEIEVKSKTNVGSEFIFYLYAF